MQYFIRKGRQKHFQTAFRTKKKQSTAPRDLQIFPFFQFIIRVTFHVFVTALLKQECSIFPSSCEIPQLEYS